MKPHQRYTVISSNHLVSPPTGHITSGQLQCFSLSRAFGSVGQRNAQKSPLIYGAKSVS